MTIREEVQKYGEFEVPHAKASSPATYKQIKFLTTGLPAVKSVKVSTSQLLKRLEFDDASELIDIAKEGIEFEITD